MKDESPAQPAPTKTEKRAETPAAPAKRKGRPTLDELRASVRPTAWKHEAAAVIHGWNDYSASPLRMEPADYAKALEAAARPNSRGEYEAHAPALSDTAKQRALAAQRTK